MPPALSDSRRSGFRWVVCAMLFAATTINYADRQILSLLKPVLDRQMQWTNEQFGWVNSAFQIAYAIGLLGFGVVIDRIGVKRGLALSLIAWSLASVLHAAVALIPDSASLSVAGTLFGHAALTVTAFGACRVLLGLGESGNFPAAISATARWFPATERALATSLFNSGANVGAMLAPFAIPVVAGLWGWPAAFLIAGCAGLLWLFVWIPLYTEPERSRFVDAAELAHILQDGAATTASSRESRWRLLALRQTWGILVIRMMTDPVWWFFLIWLPDFFKKNRGLDIKNSWHYLFTIYAMVTVFSVLGGVLTGKLMAVGWSVTRARKTVMAACAVLVLPILAVTHLESWFGHPGSAEGNSAVNWGIVLIIGLAGAAHQTWSANVFSVIPDVFPKSVVASLTGLAGMAGALVSTIFPVVCGKLLDAYGGDKGYTILFTLCGFAYVAAFAASHVLLPKFLPVSPSTSPVSSGHP